jgi:CheY-like chemotaxis protein
MMDKKRILIVDDNDTVLRLFKFGVMSLKEGFEVFIASNKREAIEVYSLIPSIDVLIVDYRLSEGETGIDIINHFRSIGFTGGTIIISGYLYEALQNNITNIDCIVQKPFSVPEIIKKIKELL